MKNELKPCPKCGGEGFEIYGYGYPLIICGIEIDRPFGTIIICEKCGYQTNAYRHEPIKAYEEWNRRANEKIDF